MAKKATYYQLAKVWYVYEGKTIGEIVLLLDEQVSERTLERWMAEGGWKEKRAAYLQSDTTYREKLDRLKGALLDRALETMDPQVVYAWAKAEVASKPGAAEKMKEIEAQEAAAKTAAGGLSPEQVEEIRRKVLGL